MKIGSKMIMARTHPSEGGPTVVAIECVAGSLKAEEWSGDMLQTGDVVDDIRILGAPPVRSPFKGGKNGLQKMLHSAYKRGDTSIEVRVRRNGAEVAELQACIVPHSPGSGRRQYALRSIHDPNYAVCFVERMESECIALQSSRNSRVSFALSMTKIQDGYFRYPWEKKMKEFLPVPNSSCFFSMLILPKALDPAACSYSSLENTLSRANAWFYASRASGVPIEFLNVQTEALLTKITGESASPIMTTRTLSDLSNLTNASLYGFEDYHGVDIGVMKAVRLWYTAPAGELAIDIDLEYGDTKLGFTISRTEEGFIYISSVMEDEDEAVNEMPSTRSGLRDLFKEARNADKLMVVSRISNEKVLPWMASLTGEIQCYGTISISRKLLIHRHALKAIRLHVLMWEMPSSTGLAVHRPITPAYAGLPPVKGELPANLFPVEGSQENTENKYIGEVSLRFNDLSMRDNWV